VRIGLKVIVRLTRRLFSLERIMNQGPAVIDPPAKRLKNVLRAMSNLGPGKKLPSFVTDTLFQVAGGPFKIEEKPQSQAPIVWQGIPAAAGTRTHPDTAVTFWDQCPITT